jgi:hypothetical protein
VRFLVTPSARAELLETVVWLRQRDRDEARSFVGIVSDRLRALADGSQQAPELASPRQAASSAEGHRLYVRERADGMWLLAVLPEPLHDLDRGGSDES